VDGLLPRYTWTMRERTSRWGKIGFVLVCIWVSTVAASYGRGPAAGRILPYLGHYIGEVVPVPKQAVYGNDVVLWSREEGAKTIVVIPHGASDPVVLAAEELSAHVAYCRDQEGGRALDIRRGASSKDPTQGGIVLAVGEAKALIQSVDLDAVPSGQGLSMPEGYEIRVEEGSPPRVVCLGADDRGLYYAVQSLKQLIRREEDRVLLRGSKISDWPSYRIRSHQFDGGFPNEETARYCLGWTGQLKLNFLGFGQAYDRPMEWRGLSPPHERSMTFLCGDKRRRGVVNIMFYPHPFRSKPNYNIRIGREEDLSRLASLCRGALEEGASGIMLRADDIHPLAEEDAERFGDKAGAHVHLVQRLERELRPDFPDFLFLFCPPFYTCLTATKAPENAEYLRKLGAAIPENVVVVWTGPITRSLVIEPSDLDRYRSFIGRTPILWDNTVYAHRSVYTGEHRNPSYLLDAFATTYPKGFDKETLGITYNWNISNPLAAIGGICTADYLWNPEAYDPERSLRAAIRMVVGEGFEEDLLRFRDRYYELFDAVREGRLGMMALDLLDGQDQLADILEQLEARKLNETVLASLRARADKERRHLNDAASAKPLLEKAESYVLEVLDPVDRAWTVESQGEWTATREQGSVTFQFPWSTPSSPGAHASLHTTLPARAWPAETYLVFSVSDDYRKSGTPQNAWPGYLKKEILLNDEILWEDDVEGVEPLSQEILQIVRLPLAQFGGQDARLTLRARDVRGVGNMGVRIAFGRPRVVAGPFSLLGTTGEIPDEERLQPTEAFTILCRARIGKLGKRQALYAKGYPHQYFAFLTREGRVHAGIFISGKEVSLSSQSKVKVPSASWIAFVRDGEEIRLYLDGQLEGEARVPGTVDEGHGNLFLGSYPALTQPLEEGQLLEWAIYDRALTGRELEGATSGQERAFPVDLLYEAVGRWIFSEEGTRLKEMSTGEQDGAIYRLWRPGR